MDNTRVKINLKTGEVEFKGSENFVQNQMDNLDTIIDLLSSDAILPATEANQGSEIDRTAIDEEINEPEDVINDTSAFQVPSSFGEWLHKFKDTINDLEKALVTAYFVQHQSEKNDFKTLEVNNALREHGIKLSNPSQALKKLEAKKYLFQTRKEGPKIRFMRVSQDGLSHLKTLLR